MADLEPLQNKLRSLVRSKPNSAGRMLIEEGLGSKWEGTQSLALKALGAWGDQWSMTRLKSFLLDEERERLEGALLIVIVDALAPNLKPKDRDWVLEYCDRRSKDRDAYVLRRLSDRLAKFG